MKAAGRTLSVTELIDGFEHVTADRWSNMPVMVRLSDGQDYSVSGVVSGDGGSVVLEVGGGVLIMTAAGRALTVGELSLEIWTVYGSPDEAAYNLPDHVVVKLTDDLTVDAVAVAGRTGELEIDCTPFYAPEQQGNEELLAFVLELAEERTPEGQPTALARRAQSVLDEAGY